MTQLEWGGQFEQLESASQRLMIVVPAALMLIFVLLYLNFQAALPALLIFLNIPLAATGGIVALLVRGMPFSISAAVGFISLFGVSVMNGIILISYYRELRHQGMSREAALRQAEAARRRAASACHPRVSGADRAVCGVRRRMGRGVHGLTGRL